MTDGVQCHVERVLGGLGLRGIAFVMGWRVLLGREQANPSHLKKTAQLLTGR